MAKAFLLDMDGVIVDSEVIFLQCQVDYLKEKGVSASLEDVQWQIGLSNAEIARGMVSRFSLPMSAEACEADQGAFFGNQYLDNPVLKPMEGLEPFLRAARAGGAKTAVVSSTQCYGILSVLNRFGLVSLFDAVVGCDFVTHRKPHPEPYLLGAGFLGVQPQDCVVIEDSPTGIKAGRAAGMYVVGFTGAGIRQDVSEANETQPGFAAIEARLGQY